MGIYPVYTQVPGWVAVVGLAFGMKRISVISLLSLFLIAGGSARSQDTARFSPPSTFSAKASLLKIQYSSLYIWVEAPFAMNRDFRLNVLNGSDTIANCAIREAMGPIAVSDTLSAALIQGVRKAESLELEVCFDTTRIISRTLRVGMPAIFRDEFTFGATSDSASRGITTPEYRYYQRLSEAEIELAIGKLDVLIVPRTEVPDNADCTYQVEPTGSFVEWFIISNLTDNDLYTCALSYCLKNQFVVGSELSTLLLDSAQISNNFPRNKEKARALFDRVRSSFPSRRCRFDSEQLPGLSAILERELSTTGGRLTFESGYGGSEIRLLHVAQPAAESLVTVMLRARDVFFDGCIRQGWVANDRLPASCRDADSISQSCRQELSNWLSHECRFIPLGRVEMVALFRADIHHLTNDPGTFSLRDYYQAK